MKPIKKIALFHSLCSVGKASLTNMMPILSHMGIEACPMPTIILSTHTGGYGVPAKQIISPEYICSMADHYKRTGTSFEMIFVGYLGSVELVDAIRYFIEQFPNTPVMIDPIMGDHGTCYASIDAAFINAFEKLLPYAHCIFPNITEAALLSGYEYEDRFNVSKLQEITNVLLAKGTSRVVITSVTREDYTHANVYAEKNVFELLPFEKEHFNFHGTGDVFDAVTLGHVLLGKSWIESIQKAHQFTNKTMSESIKYDYPEKEGLLLERTLHACV